MAETERMRGKSGDEVEVIQVGEESGDDSHSLMCGSLHLCLH